MRQSVFAFASSPVSHWVSGVPGSELPPPPRNGVRSTPVNALISTTASTTSPPPPPIAMPALPRRLTRPPLMLASSLKVTPSRMTGACARAASTGEALTRAARAARGDSDALALAPEAARDPLEQVGGRRLVVDARELLARHALDRGHDRVGGVAARAARGRLAVDGEVEGLAELHRDLGEADAAPAARLQVLRPGQGDRNNG